MPANKKPSYVFDKAIAENGDRTPIVQTADNTKLNVPQGFSELFSKRISDGGENLTRESFNEFLYMFSSCFQFSHFGNEIGWMDEIGTTVGYPLGARLIYYIGGDITKRRVLISTKDNNKDDFTKDEKFINSSWFVDNGFGIGETYIWLPIDKDTTINGTDYVKGSFPPEYHPNITKGGIWQEEWIGESVSIRNGGTLADELRVNGIQDYATKELSATIELISAGGSRGVGFIKEISGDAKFTGKTNDRPYIDTGVYDPSISGFTISNSLNGNTSKNETRSKNIEAKFMRRIG